MTFIKVIGIGSPFGKDQLGLDTIEAIKNLTTNDNIEYITADRPGTQLLDLIKDANHVILIDAINESNRAGEIVQLSRSDLVNTGKPFSSHAIGVADTLSLGKILGLLPDSITLFGICIDPSNPDSIPKDTLVQFYRTITHFINTLLKTVTILNKNPPPRVQV